MLIDFHKTSKILLDKMIRDFLHFWLRSKWGEIIIEMKGNYANFKTACFVKYLGSMLTDFHETSITGILLMRLSKISCIWKTFSIILCLLHSIFTHTHIHTYIHTFGFIEKTSVKQDLKQGLQSDVQIFRCPFCT